MVKRRTDDWINEAIKKSGDEIEHHVERHGLDAEWAWQDVHKASVQLHEDRQLLREAFSEEEHENEGLNQEIDEVQATLRNTKEAALHIIENRDSLEYGAAPGDLMGYGFYWRKEWCGKKYEDVLNHVIERGDKCSQTESS